MSSDVATNSAAVSRAAAAGNAAAAPAGNAAPAAAAASLICPACGYDLRAIASNRCPECGLTIDRTAIGQATLPWSHRHRIGRVRAYARTFFLVLLRPKRFRAEVERPVSLADARVFRRTTVWIAFVPVALVVLAVYVGTFAPPVGWPPLIADVNRALPSEFEPLITERPTGAFTSIGYAMELLILASLLLSIWLWLFAAAGVASYWFHPRRVDVQRQNRAVALSYYACAPLALTPVTTALIVVAVVLHLVPVVTDLWVRIAALTAMTAAALHAGAWWSAGIMMLSATTRCGVMRLATFFVALPLAWAALAVWIIGGIVATAVLAAVVIVTMAP